MIMHVRTDLLGEGRENRHYPGCLAEHELSQIFSELEYLISLAKGRRFRSHIRDKDDPLIAFWLWVTYGNRMAAKSWDV